MTVKAKSKRKSVVKQPSTPVAGGASLIGLAQLLPATWQPYITAAGMAITLIGPYLTSRQQQRASD